MAHPIRVFCPGPLPPTPEALMAFAAARGHRLAPYEEYADEDPTDADWDSLGLIRQPGRVPLFIELEWLEGPDARLVRAEIATAWRALGTLPPGPDRDEARARLRDTRFVAGIQVSGDAAADADWQAADVLAICLERQARGLAWIVGRGFFLDERALGGIGEAGGESLAD